MKKSVVIVGGGISGLAAAYYLQTQGRDTVDFHIVESAARLGGKIHSTQEDGFTVEGGPDSFMPRKTAVLELCRSLGLQDQLIESKNAGVFVWTNGRLVRMPEGLMMMTPSKIMPFLRSSLISWPGKIRMGLEALIPARTGDDDESLGGFVRRRLGQEALDKIAEPLFAGIYSGNAETLSLRSTFPLFAEMERKHGGLLRAMYRQRGGAEAAGTTHKPRGGFLSLRGGLQTMVDALVEKLPAQAIRLGERAVAVRAKGPGFEVEMQSGQTLGADAILFTTPTAVTADLLGEIDVALAERLRAIRSVSMATVSLGFKRSDIPHALDGSGFIVPRTEGRQITACTWSSMKFEQRAPEGFVLLRVFLGGARAPKMAERTAEELIRIARQELQITMQIKAEPVLAKAYRWLQGSPQYEVGHAARVSEIETMAARHAGLHLAGAAYRGAGIPDCIQSGNEEAKKILGRWAIEEEEEDSLCAARMEAK